MKKMKVSKHMKRSKNGSSLPDLDKLSAWLTLTVRPSNVGVLYQWGPVLCE